jgi:uncharacterized protein (TIGR03067 family)
MTFAAPALKEKSGQESTLIGEWAPEAVTVNGNAVDAAESGRWVFVTDGTWAIRARGEVIRSGTFTCDPKRSPDAVDLVYGSGGRPPSLCRYKLDGDTLVLSVGHTPGERPADIRPGPDVTVWVLKRAKKE